MTVLIVDDSLTVRMNLAEILDAAGLPAVACATLAEARRKLAEDRFSLVILDILLPDGDGIELLQEIRSDARRGRHCGDAALDRSGSPRSHARPNAPAPTNMSASPTILITSSRAPANWSRRNADAAAHSAQETFWSSTTASPSVRR